MICILALPQKNEKMGEAKTAQTKQSDRKPRRDSTQVFRNDLRQTDNEPLDCSRACVTVVWLDHSR